MHIITFVASRVSYRESKLGAMKENLCLKRGTVRWVIPLEADDTLITFVLKIYILQNLIPNRYKKLKIYILFKNDLIAEILKII